MSEIRGKLMRFNKLLFVVFYLFAISLYGLSYPQLANADSIVFKAATTASTNSGTSLVINKPTGTASGDVLIAAIAVQGANPTISSSGWTSIVKSTQGATNVTVESFRLSAGGSEPANYTFNISTGATRIAGSIVTYRGVNTSNPVNIAGTTNSGTDASLEVNSVTTTADRARIVSVYGMDNAAPRTFTPPTSPVMIERADTATSDGSNNDASLHIADYFQSAQGSFAPNAATASGTGNWASHQFALQPDGTNHMMLFWDGTNSSGGAITSPPSGWSYVTEADGRFVRGEAATSYGATGGNPTHTPTTSSVTTSTETGTLDSGSSTPAVAQAGHTHPAASMTASPVSNNVAYRTLRLIRYDAGVPNTIPSGGIAIFDGSPGIPSSGWTRMTAFDSKFVRIDSTIGSTDGGSDTHSHTLDWSDLTGSSGSQNYAALLASVSTSSNGHTHGDPNNTTTSTNGTSAADCDAAPVATGCLPQHVQILMAKADADTAVLSIGLTAMFDGAPGGGWVVRSETGGPYYQRFVRGGSSYAEGLGATTHTHVAATATTDANTGTGNNTRNLLGVALSSNGHTHLLTANFSAVDHTPEYFNIVVAEKVNFIFNHYAWYDDPDPGGNDNTVVSRYSSLNLTEDGHIITVPTGYEPPDVGKELRLRIQILVNNSNLAINEMEFRLQFRADTTTSLSATTCTDGSWTDVGNSGDSTIWKYATSNITDGGTLTSTSVFGTPSTTMQRYVKSNTAGNNVTAVNSGETMEWDYHIVNNGAEGATQYRFRLVEDSGILLSQYGYGSPTVTPVCPTLTTKAKPADQLRHGNFFENTGTEKGFSWTD